ncbi:unnamed protein product [Blepharisma stoltei]|uniref:Uncharacterized protein n=1 Tax=Blepharisma stoltei TaxID=1481888 RepID=A0AAU9JS33_9CILI|nr:unnamed protein product [Blepharisma stoltei]
MSCLTKSLSRFQVLFIALLSLTILFWLLVAYVDIQSFLTLEADDTEMLGELNKPNSFLNKTEREHNYKPNFKEKQGDEKNYTSPDEKNHLSDSNFKRDSDTIYDQKSEANLNETAVIDSDLSQIDSKNKNLGPNNDKVSQSNYEGNPLIGQLNNSGLSDIPKNYSAGSGEEQNPILDKDNFLNSDQFIASETENFDPLSAHKKDSSNKNISLEIDYEIINKEPDNTISDGLSEMNHSDSNVTQKEKDLKDLKSYSVEISSEYLTPSLKIKNPNIQCVPSIYGYTRDQAKSRFPYGSKRSFGCGENFSTFTLKDNFLYFNCSPGQYNLGNAPENELLGNVPFIQTWVHYTTPVNLGKIEFGFTKCQETKKQAFLHNKLSDYASNRAQEKRKSIENSLNLTSSKPLTVLTVVFDSVSRQHFYRILTKTVDFMNQNIAKGNFSEKFAIYDFQIEHASGENTLPNIVPLLLGNSYDDHKAKVKGFTLTTQAQESWLRVQEEDALWKHYERQGFVTMFGWETKWDYLSFMVGRKVFADHVVSSLYNAAWTQVGFCDVCDGARCIGNQYSHQFLFNYTKEFIRNYKDHNKYSYIHFSHGHEWTGSVIRSIDEDFVAFIKDVLEYYANNHEDLVLVLASDHGIHLGSWDSIEEGRIENLLPYSFVITNKEILEKIGKDTHEILSHNTQHITSKFDMHLTLKYMANVPYEIIEKDSPKYIELKNNKPKLKTAVSLFVEKIDDNRNCEDIGNPVYWCTCLKYEEKKVDGLEDLIIHIGNQAAYEINGRIKREYMQKYCISPMEFEKAISVEHTPIKGVSEPDTGLYKIKYPVKDHPDYFFSVQAVAVPEKVFYKFEKKNVENDWFPISFISTNGQQYKVQVQYIARINEKNDICMEMEASIGGKISFCVCQKPKDYKFTPDLEESQTKLYEKLVDSVSVVVGKNKASCTEACRDENKLCLEWGLQIVNQYLLLMQPWKDKNTFNVVIEKRSIDFKSIKIEKFEHGEVPGLKHQNNTFTFVQADWNILRCDSRAEDVQPICSCLKYPIEID